MRALRAIKLPPNINQDGLVHLLNEDAWDPHGAAAREDLVDETHAFGAAGHDAQLMALFAAVWATSVSALDVDDDEDGVSDGVERHDFLWKVERRGRFGSERGYREVLEGRDWAVCRSDSAVDRFPHSAAGEAKPRRTWRAATGETAGGDLGRRWKMAVERRTCLISSDNGRRVVAQPSILSHPNRPSLPLQPPAIPPRPQCRWRRTAKPIWNSPRSESLWLNLR